jgi:hypothetical protein
VKTSKLVHVVLRDPRGRFYMHLRLERDLFQWIARHARKTGRNWAGAMCDLIRDHIPAAARACAEEGRAVA